MSELFEEMMDGLDDVEAYLGGDEESEAIEVAEDLTEEENEDGEFHDEFVKVLVCVECKVPNVDPVVDDKGRSYCQHCGERLRLRTNPRVDEFYTSDTTKDKILGDMDTASDTVVRLLSTPWGRLRIVLSVRSVFSPLAYFIDKDGNNLEDRSQYLDNDGYRREGSPEPHVSAQWIRRLVNEDFDPMMQVDVHGELGVVGMFEFQKFVNQLRTEVDDIHVDPNPARLLDLDKA